jgi:MoxR-like ATPase
MEAPVPVAKTAEVVAQKILSNVECVLKGKRDVVELPVATLLAKGHLLIEDVPGVGKTTLARPLARSVGVSFQRIQFTSDLMPADVLGNNFYHQSTGESLLEHGDYRIAATVDCLVARTRALSWSRQNTGTSKIHDGCAF